MEENQKDAEAAVAEAEIGGRDSEKDRILQEKLDHSISNGKFDHSARNSQSGSHGWKSCGGDRPLLRNVLSDPMTGLLMDDAMVAQCGHSFGLRSLQRVLETNLCMSCGALVLPESLIPNYALRAAVEAFGREDLSSRKTLRGVSRSKPNEQPEASGCKIVSNTSLEANWTLECSLDYWSVPSPSSYIRKAQLNCSDDSADGGCHSKGDQDAFLVNDRVIVKSNKHIPGHLHFREAVITEKCLDGWYMVKTVDSGESIRLPYYFLQKVGENEMAFDVESGSCPGQLRDMNPKIDASDADKVKGTTLNGQTSSNSCHELPGDQDESKFMEINVYGYECENSEGDKAVSRSREIPLDSNRDGGCGDVCMGIDRFSPEGASGHSGADTDIGETKKSKRGRGGDGLHAGGILGMQGGLNVITVRSKRSSLNTRASKMRKGSCSSSRPYRKAQFSGVRKHSCTGDRSTLLPLAAKTREVSSPKTEEAKETEDVKYGISNSGSIQIEVLQMIKEGMANLEKDIPWICFQNMWRKQRFLWRQGLKECSTLQDLGVQLQELRSSLLLESAGGMPDEEWEKQLNTAKASENTDLLIYLWRNFSDDVSKWMTAKAKRSQVHLNNQIEDDEYADLKKLFPTLVIEGFSPAGVTAAAAIAAAEAFSLEGSDNTEVLLKVPMKLIRQHNHHDLIVLREALEREKRHISAKLAVLETKEYKMNGFGESAGSEQSMDTKPFNILRHGPHTKDGSIMSYPSFEFHENAISQELQLQRGSLRCKSSELVMNGKRCKSS